MSFRVGLSLMPDEAFRRATEPLFEAGEVDVLEWSFDMGWGPAPPPRWVEERVDRFSAGGRLLGHGVTFSILSAERTPRQEQWLRNLSWECGRRSYGHVSEHFGFMAAGNFHQGAPLPVPLAEETLARGREGLRRVAEAARVPVGLENLAFAFGLQDVRDQGRFLDALLAPVGGFLLLDLHNVHCQAHNFGIPPEKILDGYPLERVREIHLSGGSFSTSGADPRLGPIRRDTHDGPVPEEVFGLVGKALRACAQVEAVILERLGGTLLDAGEEAAFRAEFRRLREICRG